MKWNVGLLDLDAAAAGVAQRQQLLVHRLRHVPDHLPLVFVFRRVDVEEQRHHLRAAGAELDRLARLSLREAPQLRIIERPVLDLVDHVRPAPAGVDLVQQRARRIVQPRRGGLFRLQIVALEAGPALQRIVMPGPARQILVDVKIAVRQDVEPGALLVADHHRHRVLKLLAEANVEHAGVERPPPHAHVEPARARKRSRGGAGENQIGGGGKHRLIVRHIRYTRRMLLCPVRDCHMPLAREQRRLLCPRGHSFDVARSGYINLLQPQERRSKNSGRHCRSRRGAAAIARSRRNRAPAPLHRRTSGPSPQDIVLDAGCGDGFYLGSLARQTGFDAHGVDISIPAVDAAARRYPECEWIVANADRFVPYADRSFSIVLSITARMNAGEFRRVLRDDGRLLVALPAPDDLIELRGAGRDRAPRTIETFAPDFTLIDRRRATTTADLDAAAVRDVLLSIYRPMQSKPAGGDARDLQPGSAALSLMSQFSSTRFFAPFLATFSMARPTRSVVDTYFGKLALSHGRIGRSAA